MNKIKVFSFNPIETNTYILHDEESVAGVIIDPSCSNDEECLAVEKYIRENNIHIEHILLTHPHFDHLMGAASLCSTYGLPLELHEDAESLLAKSLDPTFTYGFKIDSLPEKTVLLKDGDSVVFGSHKLDVKYAPGHCPGSVVYVWVEENTVFTGDVLFRDSIGRTDLPGGDLDVLRESIHKQLFSLDGNYVVRSGHGGRTTIEHEMQNNPFL